MVLFKSASYLAWLAYKSFKFLSLEEVINLSKSAKDLNLSLELTTNSLPTLSKVCFNSSACVFNIGTFFYSFIF